MCVGGIWWWNRVTVKRSLEGTKSANLFMIIFCLGITEVNHNPDKPMAHWFVLHALPYRDEINVNDITLTAICLNIRGIRLALNPKTITFLPFKYRCYFTIHILTYHLSVQYAVCRKIFN